MLFSWWSFAAIFAVVVLWLSWRFFSRKSTLSSPAHKPENVQDAKADSQNNVAVFTHKDAGIENRKLSDSKGYIPLENLVISEVPIAKAESIGHLETKEEKEQDK